jgi:hypothetical protein
VQRRLMSHRAISSSSKTCWASRCVRGRKLASRCQRLKCCISLRRRYSGGIWRGKAWWRFRRRDEVCSCSILPISQSLINMTEPGATLTIGLDLHRPVPMKQYVGYAAAQCSFISRTPAFLPPTILVFMKQQCTTMP